MFFQWYFNIKYFHFHTRNKIYLMTINKSKCYKFSDSNIHCPITNYYTGVHYSDIDRLENHLLPN